VRRAFATFHPFDALNACSGQAFHFSPGSLLLSPITNH
jgi:hypothetical protein